MTPTDLPLPERRVYWAKHIQQWQHSGLSRSAYCQREGLGLNQLCYWINKDKPGSTSRSSPNFIPIKAPVLGGPVAAYDFTVRLSSGESLLFNADADLDYVAKLVKGLQS